MALPALPSQLTRTRRFTLGVPDRFTVAPDGAVVLFLRSRAGDDPVTCLWSVDLDSGQERLLADPGQLRPGATIGHYATNQAGRLAAFPLAGELWVVDAADGPARRLPAREPAAGPRPDPAGQRIGYLHRRGLRVIEADDGGDREVVGPLENEPDVAFGVAPYTGATDDARGFWWRPDGNRVLVTRVDVARVPLWHVTDPGDPGKEPRAVRYAAAGLANPEVTLWIAGLDGTRVRVSWDNSAFEYLVGAGWHAHGPYAAVQSRDQRTVLVLGIDPDSGATTVLAEQHDRCWVQLVTGLPARTGSGALVGHADAAGTRHLTIDGVPVTPPGLQLSAVLGVDGEDVLFTASEEPTETHLWSWRPGQGIERLSTTSGVHTGVRRGGTLVHVARGAERPGGTTTVRRDGKQPVVIASFAERPALEVHVTQLVLGPRQLRAALHFPSWYEPGGGPLPILADPYGGAARQRVTAELDWRCLVSQWFAEHGFAVLVADGAGTPGRGPEWEREVHGDVFGPVLEDQVTAVHEAARLYPDLDLTRVGIRGWSFGGSLAAVAVLRRPDVFHVAVAGAGVTDQHLYDAHWRERTLGHPDEFPERYEACSLIREAPNLRRPLLLMHGLADENVFPANTLRLSAALLAAGRPHEVLLLPGVGHQAMGVPVTARLLDQQARFLKRHLSI
ncbi:MAG TPA: prolyl oligopeptidase family serine peptidase [Streptosporangiaceae bacterium]|nr:prolyl oligopeptidase family serine peptidase [Streptosporangiaceae bacterium]